MRRERWLADLPFLTRTEMRMKRLIFLSVAMIGIVACSPKKRSGSARETSDPQAEMTESAEELSEYVRVSHEWKDLDLSNFIGIPPTEEEIKKWKTEFEYANSKDSVWRTAFGYFRDEAHYMAVNDLIELIHGPKYEQFASDDRCIEWRLRQFDPDPARMPKKGFAKIRYFRTLYEELLDYSKGSQFELTLGGWLDTDLREVYLRLLCNKIADQSEEDLTSILKEEKALIDKYNHAVYETYLKVQGSSSGFNGTMFPSLVAEFDVINLDMEIQACEDFLKGIMDDVVEEHLPKSTISAKDVEKEYKVFASSFAEAELTFPVEVRKQILAQERNAWNRWMDCRARISRRLDGNAKLAYDRATPRIQRHKLIMLKNRYNTPTSSFNYVAKHLLLYDKSTDEQIRAHNLETLIEEDLI